MNKKLLIIASNFPPIRSAGVYRTLRLAKYLPSHGWDLHVLTLQTDRLPQGISTDSTLLDQVSEEIPISRAKVRLPIETFNRITGRSNSISKRNTTKGKGGGQTKSKKASLVQQFKDRLTVPWMTPDRLVGWVRPASKKGIAITRNNQLDLIYSSGPPWSNHLAANQVSKSSSLPWVTDFRDPGVPMRFALLEMATLGKDENIENLNLMCIVPHLQSSSIRSEPNSTRSDESAPGWQKSRLSFQTASIQLTLRTCRPNQPPPPGSR